MSSPLLIPEPPLQLLRGLAKRIGLHEAIVLQQIYYRELLSEDGWVRRSYAEWSAADFPFWTARTVERTFVKLREKDLLIAEEAGISPTDRTLRYRVNLGAVPSRQTVGVEADSLSRQSVGVSKEKKERSLTDVRDVNPIGFDEWLAHHCQVTGQRPPGPSTDVRRKLAEKFSKLTGEGRSLEDMKLASVGAHADKWRRENGKDFPRNVLVGDKIDELIEMGRRHGGNPKRGEELDAAAALSTVPEDEIEAALASVGVAREAA